MLHPVAPTEARLFLCASSRLRGPTEYPLVNCLIGPAYTLRQFATMNGSKCWKPPRTTGGRRIYGLTHLRLLAFVKRARELGFSPDDVRNLLRLGGPDKAPCRQVRDIATDHLTDIRARITDLRKLERLLAKTVAKCTGTMAPECPILTFSMSKAGRNFDSGNVRLGSKADMCSATRYYRFVPIADIVNRKTAWRRSFQNSIWCFDQAASAAALFFLRQPSSPKPPRPVAKSGSAAGSGVADPAETFAIPSLNSRLNKPASAKFGSIVKTGSIIASPVARPGPRTNGLQICEHIHDIEIAANQIDLRRWR